MKTDKRIDNYILQAQDFAQPILNHLRALIHATCADVEEKIKWSFPHFDYKGQPMCYMASFKKHCAFGFWKASLMKDASLMQNAKAKTSMGHLRKITSLKDLPSDKKMMAYLKEAMKLNDEGIKVKKPVAVAKAEIATPNYFSKALSKNKAAEKIFNAFTASCKREYNEWIIDAKTETTRNKRIEQALIWIGEGKKRNWKYE